MRGLKNKKRSQGSTSLWWTEQKLNSYLYGVRMLRGGGSSHVWKVSCIGMGKDVRSNSCWSWMVELLKAFLMVMSWRDTGERVEKEEIHETKPSHQGTLVIFMNSNVILKTSLIEVSWLHLTTPACVHKKPYPARKIPNSFGTLEQVFPVIHFVVIFFLRNQMHLNTSTNVSCSHWHS